jgi:hypothetical protein
MSSRPFYDRLSGMHQAATATALPRPERCFRVIAAGFCADARMEQKFPKLVTSGSDDRVMKTYGMIVNLTADEERATREKVTTYHSEKPAADEYALAIEGLRYLRNAREIEIKDQG